MAKDLLIFIKLIFILTLIKRDYADGGETVSMKKSLSSRFLFTWESNEEELCLKTLNAVIRFSFIFGDLRLLTDGYTITIVFKLQLVIC